MSQLQHSPGPWTYDEWDFAIVSEHAVIATFASDDLPSTIDCQIMAAAPDMLRLLRVLSEMSESGADTKDEWYVWRDAMRDAKALIARLDGGK